MESRSPLTRRSQALLLPKIKHNRITHKHAEPARKLS
jgi:hypothetical protein